MNTVYSTDAGQKVRLGAELGRGGEGAILEGEGDPAACAKVYSKKMSDEYHRKLLLMVGNPPSDPAFEARKQHRSIPWPTAVLYVDQGQKQFAGFLMPKIDGKQFKKALSFIDPGDRLKQFQGGFTWRHLFTAGYNVASAMAAIHDRGYCVGDFNESNLVIAPSALIPLLDCDSFQVADAQQGTTYRCPVGKPEYTALELQGKSFRDHDRTVATDSFALAVMLFQLLMEGTHPYQGKGKLLADSPNTAAKIVKGHFPYGVRVKGVAPPDHAPPHSTSSLRMSSSCSRAVSPRGTRPRTGGRPRWSGSRCWAS
jgi:DNA-binding helix-hairpin-helix protein with protein kinase domain